jgi:hypothetical protein
MTRFSLATFHPDRRRFLRQTLLGSLTLSTASLFPASAKGAGTTADGADAGLRFFSTDEFLVMQTAADRIVGATADDGPSASEINAALRADRFLAGAEPEIQEQFHLLMKVINHPFFTFLFDFRLSSFVRMSKEDQDTWLEDWMTSPLAFRRQAFVGLKRLCMSMYYTEAHSWKAIGYDGLFSL